MTTATDSRLTQCERAGNIVTFVNPSPTERNAIALHFGSLKAQKHAVIADEVSHQDGSVELKIHHYRTCIRCAVGVL